MPHKDPIVRKEYYRQNYIKKRSQIIKRVLEWRKKNREKWNETRRKYSRIKIENDPQYREKLRNFGREQYRKHRAKKLLYSAKQKGTQKRMARTKLRHAILKGLVIRPKKCDACNQLSKIHGHHHDYSKPLDVVWLCIKCHGKIHRKYQ